MRSFLSFLSIVLLFLLLQFYLRSHLDLRDLPGAAGSLSVYRALQANTETGADWAALALFYLQRYSGYSIQICNDFLSIISGLLAILGGYFARIGLFGRTPIAGVLLLILWPFSHYFSLLTGVDSLAFGTAWFGVGLLCFGIRFRWFGLPLACLGLALLPLSVSIKESVLPVLGFSIWAFFSFPQKKDKRLLLGLLFIGGYCFYWSYAWFFPQHPTRLNQASLSLELLEQGWKQLSRLPKRGMPEGKLDQLLLLSMAGFLVLSKHRLKFFALSLFGALVILYTSYSLGGLLRPRYLAPAFFSIIILISFFLDQIWEKGWLGKILSLGVLFLVFMDSWSFFYIWGISRTEITGASPSTLPKPPQIWLQQYETNTDISQKDLSFYGAIEIVDQLEQLEMGIAVPRLRDDRHNSVNAFNAIYGHQALILDPGKCCLGTPVDRYCAERIVAQVRETGFSLALPKFIKGIDRIQANEKPWIQALQDAAEATGETETGKYWLFLPPKGASGPLPCQKDWR